jgi:hypothetical protein
MNTGVGIKIIWFGGGGNMHNMLSCVLANHSYILAKDEHIMCCDVTAATTFLCIKYRGATTAIMVCQQKRDRDTHKREQGTFYSRALFWSPSIRKYTCHFENFTRLRLIIKGRKKKRRNKWRVQEGKACVFRHMIISSHFACITSSWERKRHGFAFVVAMSWYADEEVYFQTTRKNNSLPRSLRALYNKENLHAGF